MALLRGLVPNLLMITLLFSRTIQLLMETTNLHIQKALKYFSNLPMILINLNSDFFSKMTLMNNITKKTTFITIIQFY